METKILLCVRLFLPSTILILDPVKDGSFWLWTLWKIILGWQYLQSTQFHNLKRLWDLYGTLWTWLCSPAAVWLYHLCCLITHCTVQLDLFKWSDKTDEMLLLCFDSFIALLIHHFMLFMSTFVYTRVVNRLFTTLCEHRLHFVMKCACKHLQVSTIYLPVAFHKNHMDNWNWEIGRLRTAQRTGKYNAVVLIPCHNLSYLFLQTSETNKSIWFMYFHWLFCCTSLPQPLVADLTITWN
jgi:hypothetical protein